MDSELAAVAAIRNDAARSKLLALIADSAEMLVDPENDQHELGGYARYDHTHADAEQAGNQRDHADEGIVRHGGERRDRGRQSEQHGNNDGKPVKDLDDGGRHEA